MQRSCDRCKGEGRGIANGRMTIGGGGGGGEKEGRGPGRPATLGPHARHFRLVGPSTLGPPGPSLWALRASHSRPVGPPPGPVKARPV